MVVATVREFITVRTVGSRSSEAEGLDPVEQDCEPDLGQSGDFEPWEEAVYAGIPAHVNRDLLLPEAGRDGEAPPLLLLEP